MAGTGLVEGVNAISLATYNDPRTSISAYDGPRTGLADIADYLPLINNPENWVKQGYVVTGAHDGVGPEAPFAPTAFVADPDTQIVEFAQDSLAVSHIEGDAGTVTFTFTVERSGGTTGAVDFTGALTSLQADDSDFGIPLPTFSGTIPEGAASVEITVTVAGDLLAEGNENFNVRLQTVSNDSAPAALGEDIVATGTIVDDEPGASIAFVGFNADAVDSLAFVTLGDIRAGTQIQFTNNNYSNATVTAATDWAFTWTATSDIAAGSIVNIDGIENGASATSNFGTIDFVIGASANLDSFAMVYAFQGSPDAPTRFLTAISNFNDVRRAVDLTDTGLEWGVNAINVPNARVAAYTGPRIGASDMDDFVALINDPANWIRQTSGSGTSHDGIAPDTPFPSTAFTIDPAVQTVFFALDSLNVAKAEGDSGTTTFTFTVQRAGGNATAGDLDFSGTIAAVTADADDFGGTLPLTFSGTILDGATTAVVTVTVSGDTLIEPVETFKLTLTSVSNATETAVLADDAGRGGGDRYDPDGRCRRRGERSNPLQRHPTLRNGHAGRRGQAARSRAQIKFRQPRDRRGDRQFGPDHLDDQRQFRLRGERRLERPRSGTGRQASFPNHRHDDQSRAAANSSATVSSPSTMPARLSVPAG